MFDVRGGKEAGARNSATQAALAAHNTPALEHSPLGRAAYRVRADGVLKRVVATAPAQGTKRPTGPVATDVTAHPSLGRPVAARWAR